MQIAILIATKDRPEKLDRLLVSITKSGQYIKQVVIVSSGNDISNLINKYNNLINLKHIHSEISGQIHQKSLGIQAIEEGIDWVLFLDDDVTLLPNSFEILISEYLTNSKYSKVFAYGLKIEGMKYRNYSWFTKLLLLLFYLYSNQKGKVLGSGHAQNYQDSLTDIATQWINGISIWRTETLQSYGLINSKLSYAAYEDVIFSYRISRHYPIFFASRVIVKSQDSEEIKPITFNQFKSGSYMRYLFVSKYPNLSKIKLLISQILRSVQFTLSGDKNVSSRIRFTQSVYIWFDLFGAVIFKRDPELLLNKRF